MRVTLPRRAGFTVTELLVTLAVLIILSGLVLAAVSKEKARTRNLTWNSTLTHITLYLFVFCA